MEPGVGRRNKIDCKLETTENEQISAIRSIE